MFDTMTPRRSFLTRLAAGVAAVAAVPARNAMSTSTPSNAAPELDTWLGTLKGSNKVIYDAVQPGGGPDAIIFARNFYKFSQDKLGTRPDDMQAIVSFRHFATPFGYTDAIWSKYPQIGQMLKIDDPKTKMPATRNVWLHDDVEGQAGSSIPGLVTRGAHFTVCGAATEFIANLLAGPSGNAAAINSELAASLVPNARIVPAGVVGLQRAQKAGFTYAFAG